MPPPFFTIPPVPVMALVLVWPQAAPEAMLIGALNVQPKASVPPFWVIDSFFDREAGETLRARDSDGVRAGRICAGGKYGGVAGGPSRRNSEACGIGVPIGAVEFHMPVGVVLPAPAWLMTSMSQYLVCA